MRSTKKIVAILILAAGAILAGIVVYRLSATNAKPPVTPRTVLPATAAPAPADTASVPATPAETAPEATSDYERLPQGEVTQTLKGRDFSLRVSVNGNDSFRDLEITLDDGTPIRTLRTLEGETGELSNNTYAPGDTFKLVELIPGEPREQIVCKGSAALTQGEGEIDTYTLYRIAGDRLEELFYVITDRHREADDNMTAQRLQATVEPTTRDGRPAFVYRVRTGGVPERTIVFVWNGKRFEDPSGEYDKIDADNRP